MDIEIESGYERKKLFVFATIYQLLVMHQDWTEIPRYVPLMKTRKIKLEEM